MLIRDNNILFGLEMNFFMIFKTKVIIPTIAFYNNSIIVGIFKFFVLKETVILYIYKGLTID
jgi:hypothetical protein